MNCPECGTLMRSEGGCWFCPICGYSLCGVILKGEIKDGHFSRKNQGAVFKLSGGSR